MPDLNKETWEQHRRRILAETSRFIEWGLNHPDEVIPIPSKPVGDVGFPRGVGEWFWSSVLSPEGGRMQRWREKLLYASMFIKGLKS